ncbi:MAG: GNAT family N-acetyltransferase [Tenericutes bacterium]|jgi:GNAT superfamily N-acetyltransferase|nr:GNAT family N-acetyltransferase [Mycoplasmatota bacterium]
MNLEIKDAKREDSQLILDFIKGIAKFEKMEADVEADLKDIETSIFDQEDAHVIIAYLDNEPVGFALYYYNYSTFKGRKGLYLEDLFIYKEHRHKGIGNQLFDYLKNKAKKENCGRMEWVCLNWNQKAIDFYLKKDAQSMDEWTTFRIDENNL